MGRNRWADEDRSEGADRMRAIGSGGGARLWHNSRSRPPGLNRVTLDGR